MPTLTKLTLVYPTIYDVHELDTSTLQNVTRKSNIKSLIISDYEHDPQVPERYLKWPKALKYMDIKVHNQESTYVESMVRCQRRSLRNIFIRVVCPGDPEIFNVSDFLALEKLTIPVCMLTDTPEDDVSML